MNKIFYTAALITLLILSACTKENLSPELSNETAVVEAILAPGKAVTVELSKMIPFAEDEYTESLTIDTAVVYISYNGTDYLLEPVSGEFGKYVSLDSNLIAVSGGSYNLSFEYDGKIVMSSTTIPSKPVSPGLSTSVLYIDLNVRGPGSVTDPMIVTWNNTENTYHLIVMEYLEASYSPISENLDPENFDQFQKVSTDPVLGNFFNLDTRQHLVFFGSYRIIIYKVNEEYVNLYENINQSSLNLTEPLTNIENGLGIFTGVNSDTLLLEVRPSYY